jgi:diguanylate cyclase (GGDEF)-like protein/PAS domain S-box-containing protein
VSSPAATILIVDDEIHNRRLLEALLRPEGYLTLSANSGEDALLVIARDAPDLILLDVMMPGMDGYQLAGILKADPFTAKIPIIIVTAHTDRSARLACLNAGAEEFLSKPIDRTELSIRVRNLLRLKAFNDFLENHNLILEQQVSARTVDLQRFRTAMDATADAITLVNRTTMRFIEVNATACKMFGYSREELFELGPIQVMGSTPEQLATVYDGVIAGRTSNQLTEGEIRRKDGSLLQVEVRRQAQRSGADWIIVGVVRDISERMQAEQRLHHAAHYDALTGLPNRTLFYDILKKSLGEAARGGWKIAVLFIDLDHFKQVNDAFGPALGDELLRQVGNRLVHSVRSGDTVGRLGGDAFSLIHSMMDGERAAADIANTLRAALRAPFELEGHPVPITASIGISIYPDDALDHETLIKYADSGMHQANATGGDTVRFFTAQMNTEVLARLDLEKALHKAVAENEFVLYYQPKVQISSGRIVGVEALLRWQRPEQGLVAPNAFIPVLEATGLIVPVGRWVIAAVCRQIGRWRHSAVGPLQVSVNVSGRQFIEGDLTADVNSALSDSAIPPELLELELTESSLMANTGRTIDTLRSLKTQGVQISIDDFGTGYSSLAYLRRFPIDKLKIDIAFVRDITRDADAAAIALAIIRMAHSLKLNVIAEGVETGDQLSYLRRHGCDQIQGYYFSPPLPLQELEALLADAMAAGDVADVQQEDGAASDVPVRLSKSASGG